MGGLVSVDFLCLKCEKSQPGEGPSRGLFCAQIRRLIVCSSSYIVAVVRGGVLKVVQCALENLIKLQIN